MAGPDPKPRKRIRDPVIFRELHLRYLGEPCWRCEQRPGTQLHHRVLRSQGGDDVPENLEWLCSVCHMDIHDGRLHG